MLNRRLFMIGAVAPVAARRLAGANDRINVAVVGVRSRGRTHIDSFARQKGCAITTICDVDLGQAERGQALALKLTGQKPEICQDIRRVLDNKNIDVVSLATP